MRKTIVAIIAAIAFLSTGCTIQVGDGGEATESPAATGSTATSASTSVESFLKTIYAEYPAMQSIPESDVLALGLAACDVLRNGGDWEEAATTIAGSGADAGMREQAAFFVGAAQSGLCPDTL